MKCDGQEFVVPVYFFSLDTLLASMQLWLSGDNALFFFVSLPPSEAHSDIDKIPSITSIQHIASITLSFYKSKSRLQSLASENHDPPPHFIPLQPTEISLGIHRETNPPS